MASFVDNKLPEGALIDRDAVEIFGFETVRFGSSVLGFEMPRDADAHLPILCKDKSIGRISFNPQIFASEMVFSDH